MTRHTATWLAGATLAVAIAVTIVVMRTCCPAPRVATDTTEATATAPPLIVTGGDSLLGLMRLAAPPDGSGLFPTPLDLHGAPGDSTPVLTTVTRWSDLVAHEIDYEEPAIAVFRTDHPWYLVETRDSLFGWLRLPDGASVVALVDLLPDRLTYLTPDWDGVLHAAPGVGTGTPVRGAVRHNGEASAEVHEARQVGDALWLRVSVHDQSPCLATGDVSVVATGWVPAWTAAQPTAWYYSRGC